METRREARDSQNTNGIFDESAGYVPQEAAFDICAATVRVDNIPIAVPGNRVDRQVTAFEILFNRDVG